MLMGIQNYRNYKSENTDTAAASGLVTGLACCCMILPLFTANVLIIYGAVFRWGHMGMVCAGQLMVTADANEPI